MRYRTLEIILQHANGLHNVNLITKMDVHAVVSISDSINNNSSHQKFKTPTDHKGNTDPTWNFPMKFTIESAALQQNRLTLNFKLACERTLGDKDVGQVNVPVKELLDSSTNGKKQTVSYQVTKPNGKPKGQITFSYQVQEKTVAAAVVPPLRLHAPTYCGAAEGGGQYVPPGFYPPAGGAPPPVLYPPAVTCHGVFTDGSGYHAPPHYGYQPHMGYGSPPYPDYGYPPHPGYGYYPSPNVHHHQPTKKV